MCHPTREYIAIKQELAEPDPLRLAWRVLIKQTIKEVVLHPQIDAISMINQAVTDNVPVLEQADVSSLIMEELRRIHEGVLARYGLRPSEYAKWVAYSQNI